MRKVVFDLGFGKANSSEKATWNIDDSFYFDGDFDILLVISKCIAEEFLFVTTDVELSYMM